MMVLVDKMGSLVVVFLLVSICIIAFIVIKMKRPLGIRIICFFGILFSIMGILYGLITLFLLIIPSLFKGADLLVLEGGNLYFAILLFLGMPLVTLIVFFNLFYLRRWARTGLMVFLSLLIINGAAALVFRKDIIYEPSQRYIQQSKKVMGFLCKCSFIIEGEERRESNNWLKGMVGEAMLVLIFLYLLRKQTKKFFYQKGRLVISKKR